MLHLTDRIIDFENGDLDENEIISLFSELIKTGLIYQLQGFYHQYARDLISNGYISVEGDVIKNDI